jgi:hypothetical protein
MTITFPASEPLAVEAFGGLVAEAVGWAVALAVVEGESALVVGLGVGLADTGRSAALAA